VEPSGHRATPGGWSTERVMPLECLLPPRSCEVWGIGLTGSAGEVATRWEDS
jgi:hypothetical protein